MLLEVRDLKKCYVQGEKTVEALRGVSFDIEEGQFVSVMGQSGSGKSTLLHLIGGLDQASGGEVLFENRLIQGLSDDELSKFRRRRLGFIFQFFNLLPSLTALENVALPLLLDGKSISGVKSKALNLLSRMGLSKRQGHYPNQLSGGEMQRVAIARALVTDPLLILADEPTGNLDSSTGKSVLELLAELSKEQKQTVVMVTHDVKASLYGDRLIILKDGLIDKDRTPFDSSETLEKNRDSRV